LSDTGARICVLLHVSKFLVVWLVGVHYLKHEIFKKNACNILFVVPCMLYEIYMRMRCCYDEMESMNCWMVGYTYWHGIGMHDNFMLDW